VLAAEMGQLHLHERGWGPSYPDTTAKLAPMSRSVTGMPAHAGPASAEVTPGTISNRQLHTRVGRLWIATRDGF